MNAIQTLLTDQLDIWTSADTAKKSGRGRSSGNAASVYGIKKLRELILELAVRGKLVPQDPDDEPASVLLKRIQAEKARLIAEGKIKKEKSLPEISDDEKYFALPNGWEWSRLQDVSSYVQRGKGPRYADFGRVQVVSQKCIQWAGFDLSQTRYVDDASLDGYQTERFLRKDDLLWNSTGTGTAGRINVVPEINSNSLVADSHVTIIRPLMVSSSFLSCYVAAPGIQQRIEPEHENSLVSGTTNQVELNLSAVVQLVVPVPPLAEQHRIVAKVDELMAMCDQLEQQQTHSIAAHQALAETMLGTLTRVASQQEFSEAWARIASHFDTLFTTEASIDQLKQTILQLAVMGKLVTQDFNDEPASVFLAKIAQEKAMLIKAGDIRKQKELPEIKDNQIGFNLSAGWAVSRLGTFTNVGTGATPSRDKTAYWSPQEVNWVASGETSNDFITETSEKVSSLAVKETNVTVYPVGTLIVAMYGQGKTRGQVAELMIEAGTNQACAAVVLINKDEAHRKYLKLFFKKAYEEMRSHSAGGAQPNLNVGKISDTVVPLPPLLEQKRIVAKVDELMTLCDTLKARLSDAQTIQLHLADAIVEQAVC